MGMTILIVLGYIVFGLVLIAGLICALLGLPGTAIIWFDGLIFAAITGWDRIPWWVLLITGILAIIAEASDGLIAALGTKAGGGTNQTSVVVVIGTAVGALLGGMLLSVPLAPLGVFAPIVASLAGALALGFASAYYYERHRGREHKEALKAGWGAFMGRMAAGLFKMIIGGVMTTVFVWSIMATAAQASGG